MIATIAFLLLGIGACIFTLSLLVDAILIPQMKFIQHRLSLRDDQMGVMMSFVSSAPELSVSLSALALAYIAGSGSDSFAEIASIGPATVIGSSMFSLLCITGLSAWFNTQKPLTSHVFLRDICFYISALVLLLVSLSDSSISLVESGLFILLYGLYVFCVSMWGRWFKANTTKHTKTDQTVSVKYKKTIHQAIIAYIKTIFTIQSNQKFVWLRLVLYIFIAITGIVISSALLVQMSETLADLFAIPPAFVGLTILAAGTSLPDLLASISVVKSNQIDTAITNAISSNIFDILGNLGFTWFIVLIITLQTGIAVSTGGLNTSVLTLIVVSCILVLFLLVRKFTFQKSEAVFLLAGYGVYVISLVSQLL